MKNFDIGIIGGRGAMGAWFAAFFRNCGYRVRIADRDSGPTLPELAARCSVVVVSVPIGATNDVIEEVGPHMRKDALLMDLTSLKAAPVAAMLRASVSEVIGLHPLFGPDVPSLEGQNIVVCPGRGETWLPWLRELIESNGAHIVVATPEKHDAMMALIQGLTHLNTMVMGLVLRDTGVDPAELDLFSTPVFRARQAMIEKVFHQNPRMYAEILTGNPGMAEVLSSYETKLSILKHLVESRDVDGITGLLTRSESPEIP